MASEYDQPPEQIEPALDDSAHASPGDEIDTNPLDDAPGFKESPEFLKLIQEIKNALTNPATDPEHLRRLWDTYGKLFEDLAELQTGEGMYVKIQILAILHKAFIFKEVGNTLRYLEELDFADTYAWNLREDMYDALSIFIGDEVAKHAESSQTSSSEPSP